jgi:predicted nucleic acid-binding protein
MRKKIADAGLLIAALDARDEHHGWARQALEEESPPWLVCEPVLAEVSASIGTPRPAGGSVRVSRVTGDGSGELKEDPLYQAKPLGRSADGRSAADHDALLYGR